MKTLYRVVAAMLVAILFADSTLLALDSKDAAYFGGTITVFGNPKDAVEGKLDTSDEKTLLFAAYGREFAGKTFSISYAKISDLEYGQKAGRRVGAAAEVVTQADRVADLVHRHFLQPLLDQFIQVGFIHFGIGSGQDRRAAKRQLHAHAGGQIAFGATLRPLVKNGFWPRCECVVNL